MTPASVTIQPPEPGERSLIELLSLTDAGKFILESLLLLGIIQFVLTRYGGAPAGTGGMPHPFWIPVLLMSAQYGIMGGLFATLAASATMFLGGLPPQSAAEDFYDYAAVVAAQPCAWFASALILGGLRTLHMHQHGELGDRLERATRIGCAIADRLEQTIAENERLERRIATDLCTLTAVLRGLAELDVGDRRTLARGFAAVIGSATGATSFVLYINDPTGLQAHIAIEDGIQVAQAIGPAPLAWPLRDHWRPAGPGKAVHLPIWAAIRSTGAEPIGVVVCTRLNPAQDIAAAGARLAEICAVLAALLVMGQSTAPQSAPA
jgi:hypothetical protein